MVAKFPLDLSSLITTLSPARRKTDFVYQWGSFLREFRTLYIAIEPHLGATHDVMDQGGRLVC